MPKRRVGVAAAVKARVLSEFNHRCAICGADKPQLHHIDETPDNNDPENLLPLCPNCHLTDQHNPTASIEPGKLRLFRKHKNPLILTPQFHPLYVRFAFLFSAETGDMEDARLAAVELVAFLDQLQMGRFYHVRVADLITDNTPRVWSLDASKYETDRRFAELAAEYRKKLLANRDRAVALIVEQLRYQNWPPPSRVH